MSRSPRDGPRGSGRTALGRAPPAGRGSARVPDPPARRKGAAGPPRYHAAPMGAHEASPRDAPLLPPSRPRDAPLVLELRAADLHRHDPGGRRRALPGVRRGQARGATPRPVGARVTGTAVATTTLVAINVLVFLVEMAQGVAVRGVGGSELVDDGAIYGPAVADGEWWRLVTGGFLHAGLIHLAFNMYLLWMLGGALERYAGAGRFLAIYFTALLWGSAGALLLSPDSRTVGASGAVFGLMAASSCSSAEGHRAARRVGGGASGAEPGLHVRLPGGLHRRARRRHPRRRRGRVRPLRLRPRSPRLRPGGPGGLGGDRRVARRRRRGRCSRPRGARRPSRRGPRRA